MGRGPGPVEDRLDQGDEQRKDVEEQYGEPRRNELHRSDGAIERDRHEKSEYRASPAIPAPQCEGSSRQPGVADECDDKGERADHGNRQPVGTAFVGESHNDQGESETDCGDQREDGSEHVAGVGSPRANRVAVGVPNGHRGMLPRPARGLTAGAAGSRLPDGSEAFAGGSRAAVHPRPATGSEMSAGILRGPCFGQSDSSAVAKRTSSSTAGTRNIWF